MLFHVEPDQELMSMQDYERGRRIGQGAFGCALLVTRKKDGKRLVAKEINVVSLPEKEQLNAMQEVDVMRALKHVNIITLHKHFLEGGNLYIIMEFAEGGDLAGFLKKGQGVRQAAAREQGGGNCGAYPCRPRACPRQKAAASRHQARQRAAVQGWRGEAR